MSSFRGTRRAVVGNASVSRIFAQYPIFVGLATFASLEAIFPSTFVLISQNRIDTRGTKARRLRFGRRKFSAAGFNAYAKNAGEFSVLNILGTANLSGQLKPLLLNGFLPTVGESFTFLQYGAVNGTLFMFNRNIDDLPEHWEVSYFPTFAVLTVAAGNVPVPDQGSTFVLLMLGLSALLMCRRHCLRRFRTKGS
jgi:VPDSG-CTERM motif